MYRAIHRLTEGLVCPNCSNILTVGRYPSNDPDEKRQGKSRFECRTCPYESPIMYHLYERRTMKKKEVEDVMGGAKAWENVDKTAIQCTQDGCDGDQAYFMLIQLRSADEPSTIFYKVERTLILTTSPLTREYSVRNVGANGGATSCFPLAGYCITKCFGYFTEVHGIHGSISHFKGDLPGSLGQPNIPEHETGLRDETRNVIIVFQNDVGRFPTWVSMSRMGYIYATVKDALLHLP